MPKRPFLSSLLIPLAVAAGLAYSDVRFGEIVRDTGRESAIGIASIGSEVQWVQAAAITLSGTVRAQLAISRNDLEILGRDLTMQIAKCKDRLIARAKPPVSIQRDGIEPHANPKP